MGWKGKMGKLGGEDDERGGKQQAHITEVLVRIIIISVSSMYNAVVRCWVTWVE